MKLGERQYISVRDQSHVHCQCMIQFQAQKYINQIIADDISVCLRESVA